MESNEHHWHESQKQTEKLQLPVYLAQQRQVESSATSVVCMRSQADTHSLLWVESHAVHAKAAAVQCKEEEHHWLCACLLHFTNHFRILQIVKISTFYFFVLFIHMTLIQI